MTHDKLLLKIDESINWYEDQKNFEEVIPYMVALRSIVAVHEPYNSGPFQYCWECNGISEEEGTEYPCGVIESVLEALGEDIE